MLPCMPGVMRSVFTKSNFAFHKTFTTIGKKSQFKKKDILIIWPEGVAGMKAEKVISIYVYHQAFTTVGGHKN